MNGGAHDEREKGTVVAFGKPVRLKDPKPASGSNAVRSRPSFMFCSFIPWCFQWHRAANEEISDA